jgi:hypothetical protein|nr:MAG TPA: Replication associated protein [Microviridae sp.]
MIQSDKLKIFGGCLNPVFTYNKWTGEPMFCACNKCVACLNARAEKQSMRLNAEIRQHKYNLMVTLTYNNEFVPRWEKIYDDHDCPQFRPIGRCEYMYNSCPLNYFDKKTGKFRFDDEDFIPRIEGDDQPNVFACVCKKDLQNFMKRLRKRISNLNIPDNEKKIRYYFSSEYGPTTLRPHYHGVLSFDNEVILSKIVTYIIQSWSFTRRTRGGNHHFESRPFADIRLTRENCKICDPNTSFYIAQYVSGNTDLPRILGQRETNPFHISSKSPIIGNFKSDAKEIFDNIHRGNYRVDAEVFNEKLGQFECKHIPLNRDLCSSLFRKCKGFSSLSFNEKFRVYSFFGSKYGEWLDSLNIELIKFNFENDIEMSIADFLQRNRQWKYRYWLESNYSREYYQLEYDLDQNYYSARNAFFICKNFNFNSFYPYVDPLVSYLRLFDKYDVMRNSDQMINFYEIFNYIVEHAGFPTAMLSAYPLIWDNIPVSLPVYSFAFDDYSCNGVLCNAYSDAFARYIVPFTNLYGYGMVNYDKLKNYSLYNRPYYTNYVNQQLKRFNDKNKSKKRNNTNIYGYRKIS